MTLAEIFNNTALQVSISYIEIYNEKVFDLLQDYQIPLKVVGLQSQTSITGLSKFSVRSQTEAMDILQKGE